MTRRRVGAHQHFAVDRYTGVHDFLLPSRRGRHRLRGALMGQHHLDLCAEHFLVELERRLATAVVKQIGVDLHRFLLVTTPRRFAYLSVRFFSLARPASKSLPIILSMFMNTCMTLD